MELEFKVIAKSWFDVKKRLIKPSSASSYYTIVYSGLIPFFNNREINNNSAQEYVIYLTNKGLSKRTVQDHLKLLSYILKDGEQKGMCKSQAFNVEFPTVLDLRKRESKAFPVTDINALRSYLIGHSNNNLYNFAILLALSLGLRIGEVTGLKFSDFCLGTKKLNISRTSQRISLFNEDNKIVGTSVNIGTPKTKSSVRKLPVPDIIIELLKVYSKDKNQDDFIFRRKYSKMPMDNRLLREKYYQVLNMLNIPKITFHGLRHSFASNCIASNIDIKTTSAMLGHSDIKMTLDIYTHPSFEQKKVAINKLSKLFS